MVKTVLAKNCSELSLQKFIRCLIYSDFSQLIITKGFIKPKKKQLLSSWMEVYQEFTDLGASNEGNAYLSLLKQRTILNNKIFILSTCLESLNFGYNLELIKIIRKLGLKGRFTRKTLREDLNRAVTQLKSLMGRLVKMDKNLLPYTSGKEMKEEDFHEVLTVLSKFQGYRLKADEISVTEYVHILNSYKKWQTPKK